MARCANTSLTMETTIDNVHKHDYLIGKDGVTRFLVDSRRRLGATVEVVIWRGATYRLDACVLVNVQVEHECSCSGSGIYYISGGTVNGVFVGQKGTCYGCAGKGWQSRSDVIRNETYWSKYARVYA